MIIFKLGKLTKAILPKIKLALTIILCCCVMASCSANHQSDLDQPKDQIIDNNDFHLPDHQDTEIIIPTQSTSPEAEVTVPTQLVRLDVEKYFSDYDIMFNIISHDYDTETHIDTVEAEVTLLEKYYSDKMIVTVMYRYNKSNDTWDLYDSISYRDKEREYNASAYTGHWEGYFDLTGRYDVYITSVDFDRMTISGSFYAVATSYSLETELSVEGEFAIEDDGYDYMVRINNDAYTFTFRLDPKSGFEGVNIKHR